MKIVVSPNRVETSKDVFSIFLAGSIEMGKARDWQAEIQDRLGALHGVIFNPRRADWDASWGTDASDDNFRTQVEWELDHLEKADLILFYFDPMTKAPISLMELGLFSRSGKCVVCCPDGYWRRGNLQIVCARYGIPLVDSLEQLLTAATSHIASNKLSNAQLAP